MKGVTIVLMMLLFTPTQALVAQQEPLVAAGKLRSLENAARTIARSGMANEAHELHEILVAMGLPEKAANRLLKEIERSLARVKKPKDQLPAVARQLQRAAKNLTAMLAPDGDARTKLAHQILRLDGACVAARKAVGQVLVAGQWLDQAGRKFSARRQEIQEALRLANSLPVELTSGTSEDALLAAVLGQPGVFVRIGNLEVHSSWSEKRLRRILTATVRALAVSNWLLTGKLEAPTKFQQRRWLLLHSKVDYERAVDQAASRKALNGSVANAKQLSCFFGYQDFAVDWNRTEADTQASFISRLADNLSLPCLTAGHQNWICQAVFGTRLPGYVWIDIDGGGKAKGGTSASRDREQAERREFQRMAEAGLLGSRSWMAYLAARGEDPPWSRSFLDDLGKVVGDDLCKSTIVMDFLYENGPINRELARGTPASLATSDQIKHIEAALQEQLSAFEKRWRAWLQASRASLVERLGKSAVPELTSDERVLLRHLGDLRKAAFARDTIADVVALKLDPSLSRGARLHADYLNQNPVQLKSWPEAHEEFADKPGFTAQGSWGGLHSVIAPGVAGPREAIDAWMGTFYHRLPLLETGLLRVGWGYSDNTAVLDASSLSRPRAYMSMVVWPADGMKGVPTRFRPELPSPVPGEDQSKWGYPITVQLGHRHNDQLQSGNPTVNVTLHASSESGAVVPCHYSTPDAPSNAELAPADTWCLIPKQALKKGSTYVIVVELPDEAKVETYRFKT